VPTLVAILCGLVLIVAAFVTAAFPGYIMAGWLPRPRSLFALITAVRITPMRFGEGWDNGGAEQSRAQDDDC
jgi:hypothetical protein